jgi:REP element-mobilizing transposase RayT
LWKYRNCDKIIVVMEMNEPVRKTPRLAEYDYSQPGVYFVTICTKDKQKILCDIVGEGLCALPSVELTSIGKVVEDSIRYLHDAVDGVAVEKYVIMPNHIHMLIRIFETGGHRGPPLQKVVGQFKSYTTHCYQKSLWQRSFHDHVVRGEEDYREIWKYIDQNPLRWENDTFYVSD